MHEHKFTRIIREPEGSNALGSPKVSWWQRWRKSGMLDNRYTAELLAQHPCSSADHNMPSASSGLIWMLGHLLLLTCLVFFRVLSPHLFELPLKHYLNYNGEVFSLCSCTMYAVWYLKEGKHSYPMKGFRKHWDEDVSALILTWSRNWWIGDSWWNKQ